MLTPETTDPGGPLASLTTTERSPRLWIPVHFFRTLPLANFNTVSLSCQENLPFYEALASIILPQLKPPRQYLHLKEPDHVHAF